MKPTSYLKLLREKGRPLSEINPGSDEMALTLEDALLALEKLKDSQTAILGGDVLTEESGRLIYAYQLWGDEYIYLNWYCERIPNEGQIDYSERSYFTAKESILNARKVSVNFNKKCYIVLVI